MTETAPVSAIVPLFNGRRFIRQAIDSILGQERKPREIVVVDDGSTDGGCSRLSYCPEIRLIRQPNGGEAAARNRGIRESTQPLIAFLDQDDLWLRQKLALQVRALEADPSVDIVFGQHRIFAEEGANWFRRDLLDRTLTAELPGSLVIRRTVFDRIGLYREDMILGSDVDWICRAHDAGIKSQLVEDVLLLRRVHQGNSSIDQGVFMSGLLRVARASVRRKRCLPAD
jgi:glycosyltransferase involved in cell wall biosynthesis